MNEISGPFKVEQSGDFWLGIYVEHRIYLWMQMQARFEATPETFSLFPQCQPVVLGSYMHPTKRDIGQPVAFIAPGESVMAYLYHIPNAR